MTRHEFLRRLHAATTPRTYLEIGVSDGRSLTLSSVPSIGIDPALRVKTRLHPDVTLVKATSDAFFARSDPLRPLSGQRRSLRELIPGLARPARPITLDLAFIDGMHLFEFALRDFMNVERFAAWTSVIVFDDVLPRSVDEAARDRHTKFWAGDVYKVIGLLREQRPDLVVLPVDTAPTGTLVVLGADPANRVLTGAYDDIVRTWATPDPQAVPATVLSRSEAIAPQRLLDTIDWAALAAARLDGGDRSTGLEGIRAQAGTLIA